MTKSAKRKSVQDRLRDQRVIRGLSVAELAEGVGCSTRYLFLLEAGDRLPRRRIARRWSRMLGSSIRSDLEAFSKQVGARAEKDWLNG